MVYREIKMLASLSIRPTLIEKIGASQRQDAKLVEILNHLEFRTEREDLVGFEVDQEGFL